MTKRSEINDKYKWDLSSYIKDEQMLKEEMDYLKNTYPTFKDFYGKFKFWDTIMHISSGILLSMFGIIIINSICYIKSINVYPLIIVFLSFCFVMMMQSMWEIYEYTMDHFIGTNMQTYMNTTTSSYIEGENIALCGHNALNDTMKDFICNALSFCLFLSN